MANGRGGRVKLDKGRDGGRFITLPVAVLESAAYLALSANARSLLLEVALQCHGDDNGRLLLSRAYLNKRGLMSSDMIVKGKRELLDAELIFETVKGQRPNKASWYAVTWRSLDKHPGFDHGADKAFKQGAYRKLAQQTPPTKNAVLKPCHGTEGTGIAPPHGTEKAAPVPPHGAIRRLSAPCPVPPHGHPLEKPSAGVSFRPLGMAATLRRAHPVTRPAAYHAARAGFTFPH